MFNISECSQVERLNKIMSATEISDEESRQASSIIRYLCDYHGCRSVYQAEAVNAKLSPGLTNYQEIKQELQLPTVYNRRPKVGNYYYYNDNQGLPPLDIAGYSKLQEIGNHQAGAPVYYSLEKQKLVINDELIDINRQLAQLAKQANANNQLTKTSFEIMVDDKPYKIFVRDMIWQEEKRHFLTGWVAY